MKTRDEVKNAVITTIAGFTRLPTIQIEPEMELNGPFLALDANQLTFMAMTLRGYVKYYSSGKETVVVSELRKSGLTVSKLINLIYKKVSTNE